jgi:hypothetical protein
MKLLAAGWSKSEDDCHDEMNDDSFRKYFYEHVLLNGSKEAVVMDNYG